MSGNRERSALLLYAVGGALLLGGAYLCFELGRYQAGYSLLDHRRQVAGLESRAAERSAEQEELRRQIAVLETSRDIDRETYAQIETTLGELEARLQSQEEELVFYRGIVSPENGRAGLGIQTLEALAENTDRRYLLRLVLVQAIVHSRRVSGTVRLRFDGIRDGQPATYGLEQLVTGDERTEMAYEFRYFESLERELVLPEGFEPDRVEVEIRPSEPPGDRLTRSFEWSVISG